MCGVAYEEIDRSREKGCKRVTSAKKSMFFSEVVCTDSQGYESESYTGQMALFIDAVKD